MNTSKQDIALCVNNKILETGTSNLLFVYKKRFIRQNQIIIKEQILSFMKKNFVLSKRIFT